MKRSTLSSNMTESEEEVGAIGVVKVGCTRINGTIWSSIQSKIKRIDEISEELLPCQKDAEWSPEVEVANKIYCRTDLW
ncbi:MAG: hypothetical protein CM15mP106_7150 [Candidatus Neomarinimicrobiota bacterium]|nr:MAG: hypothetical protein CM15mP106_7150 [Candidatus Neomarinimicrobiota bacterium]